MTVEDEQAGPAKMGWMGRFAQGLAIVVVVVAGIAGGSMILAYERPVALEGGHGAHSDHDKHGGAEDGHGHGHDGGEHGHEDEGIIKLTPAQLKNAGLTIEEAAPAKIKQTLKLNGIIRPNEEGTVAVLPRFGGVVKTLTKRLGDTVTKGEVVASIESNESLTQYDITAPISGTVIERHGSLGAFAASDKRLFVISDLSDVWVDLRAYSRDFSKLKLGQEVNVFLAGHDDPHASTISYLSPIGVTNTQSMVARAVVQNSDGGFLPGLFVTGYVTVREQPAAVAVKETAIQFIDSKPVVFVQGKEGFEVRQVELGYQDGAMAEVLFGVLPGDKVVTGNSFILKAERGKGEAEHVH